MKDQSPIAGQWQFDSAVMALALSRDNRRLAAATADGMAQLLATGEGAVPEAVQLHGGATLSLVAGFGSDDFIAGGEDGRLVALDGTGAARELAVHKHQWLEQIVVAPTLGQVFYGVGKTVARLRRDGSVPDGKNGAAWLIPSTPGSLALHPQEKRLAVAHYNGVSIYPLNAKHAEPMRLNWQGSHLLSAWHPDGDIICTTMQEAGLHGWRLSDRAEMRMSGYMAKPEALAFMDGGRYLATAGSPQLICWPFFGGGPWGKAPLLLGPDFGVPVTRLAPHPADSLVAVGYDNGALVLLPVHEGNALPLLPASDDKLAALVWTDDGRVLYAGCESGMLYRFTVESVSAAFEV